ncbi:MAG: ROK family protein, partial [Acidobacteria bacterium]|nr:ROK family protein [Acidobacteriota bacterium]
MSGAVKAKTRLRLMRARAVLAVDIGGTKIEVAVVDESGTVLERRRTPTAGRDGEAVFAVLSDVCSDLLSRYTVA